MDLDSVLSLCLKSADEAEVFLQDVRSTSVFLDANTVDQALSAHETGFSLRVLKDHRVGFAISPGLPTLQTVADSLKRALASARQNKPNPAFHFVSPSATRGKDAFDPKLDAITEDPSDLAKLAQTVNKELQSHGAWVPISQFKASTARFTLANSNGVNAQSAGTTLDAEMYAIAKSSATGARSEVIAPLRWRQLDETGVEKFAHKVATQAKELLNASPVATQEMNVIFAPGEFAALLSQTVGEALDGAAVLDGTSPYKDKMGLRVAPETFTLIDHVDANGLTPKEVGGAAYAFDFEGNHRPARTLIKNGVLQGFAFDAYHAALATAQHPSDPISSTSNARRSAQDLENAYKTGVGSGLGHFEVQIHNKGGDSHGSTNGNGNGRDTSSRLLDHLIRDVKDGLLVTRTGWPLADEVSGRFSCEVRNGYLIKNGELSTPVKSTLVAASLFELLEKQTLGFSKERETHATSSAALDSSALVPYAAFEQVRVASA